MANTPIVRVESLHRHERLNSRYRLIGEVGSGAFGAVCIAEDTTTGSPVAIRLLPNTAARARGGDVLERISPAIIAASGGHPALVRILDTGRADSGRPFVVTEFTEGRRLSDVLASGPLLDVPAALAIALELGGAVETVHNMGLVHGALRTRNVMVLADGRVKLMDIELVNLRDTTPIHLASAAPPAEAPSPEQLRDEVMTEKTDIFSFASIVYEMLCGAPPFAVRDAAPAKPGPRRPAWPRDRRATIPPTVQRIIEEALCEEPERRPFMSQLLNALVLKPSGRFGSRRRIAMVGATALATIGVGMLGWSVIVPRTTVVKGPVYSTRSVPSMPATPSPVPPTASPPRETASRAPVSAPLTPSAPPPAVAAPSVLTAPPTLNPAPTRATTPAASAGAASRETASKTPVGATARVNASMPDSRTAGMPRREPAPPRRESASTASSDVSPHRPTSTADDGYDPAAVIDWVLSDSRR